MGYALGDAFTPHHRVVDYFEHVAANSPQVSLTHYGATYEGRPLFFVVVASEENMAQLETIRIGNLQRAGLHEGEAAGPAPAIVWLSYNVHGNESVSTESAMETIYALQSSDHPGAQAWLQNTIVIIDPCMNPDGRDRYVHFFTQARGRFPNVLPEAREHSEPWPGGRTNHYYFDLNRDWAWGTQAETQQRLPHYQAWMPHIHVDFHEQGVDQPYFFAPAAEPFHEAITPWQRELQGHIGSNHARYFDAEGWLYFTRQVFDLFYPGYGDTWPTFNGAIGMTYEQGGSGRAGLGILTAEGDTLTLRDRIDHHTTTGLSTVESASLHQARIVEEFVAFFRDIPDLRYGTYVVKGDGGDKVEQMARHLTEQGIQFGTVARAQEARGYSFKTGNSGPVTIGPGDMVVSTRQPRHVLTRVLFEPQPTLDDSLSYDITAWALPYVYGVEAYALPGAIVPDTPWPMGAPDLPPSDPEAIAYLAEWQSFEDARLLAALLHNGINVRFAEEPFTLGGREWDRGTLIVTKGTNRHLGAAFHDALHAIGQSVPQPMYPVTSSQVTQGVDFGSSDVPFLDAPRVAVLSGEQVSAYRLGEVWHYFDQQLGYPVTLVNAEDFGQLHLYEFDVIVLPSGSYRGIMSDGVLDGVRSWIRSGGRLIALEGAARFLEGQDGFALKEREDDEEDSDDEEDEDTPSERQVYAERNRERISERITGAVVRVDMDTTHPLGFGYTSPYFTLKQSSDAYELMEDEWNVGILTGDAVASGFVGAEAREALEDALVFGVQDMGRGEVVYLLDNPLFRGFWVGGRLLFANAVFLVGQRSGSSF